MARELLDTLPVEICAKILSHLWRGDVTAQEVFSLTRVSSMIRRYESHYWYGHVGFLSVFRSKGRLMRNSYRGELVPKKSIREPESSVLYLELLKKQTPRSSQYSYTLL